MPTKVDLNDMHPTQIMAIRLKFCIFFIVSASLMACHDGRPQPAQCRVDQQFLSSLVSGGACIVTLNERLLVMIDRANKVNIPRQQKAENKSAQCAAHQAVWQHTGFNVEVGPRLGQLEQDIELFACELNAGFDGTETFQVPDWSLSANSNVTFINPYEFSALDWVNPNDHVRVLDAFIVTENTQQLFKQDAHE